MQIKPSNEQIEKWKQGSICIWNGVGEPTQCGHEISWQAWELVVEDEDFIYCPYCRMEIAF